MRAIAALILLSSCGPDSPWPGHPNLALIVVDTLRADHLSCYGYTKLTTPNLDNLAGKTFSSPNTFSSSTWTLPSAGTLLSGLLLDQLGLRGVRVARRLPLIFPAQPGWRPFDMPPPQPLHIFATSQRAAAAPAILEKQQIRELKSLGYL